MSGWLGWMIVALDALLVLAVVLRVVATRHPPGSSFAWILVTLALPFAGFLLYLLVGEHSIGRARRARLTAFAERFGGWRLPPPPVPHEGGSHFQVLSTLANRLTALPASGGNRLQLIADTHTVLARLADDIAGAEVGVDLAFYIWNAGGDADHVEAALIATALRGVPCRVLLDAIGAKRYLASEGAARLRAAGVRLEAAMTVRAWQLPFVRGDLRLHRKIALIDGRIGYTGSLNLVDPRYFKQDAGVGEWVDAMARIEGPVLDALAAVFAYDWMLQTGEPPARAVLASASVAWPGASAQVVPSGPGTERSANLRLIVEAVNQARRQILLTTPYFVPGEALALALQNAALRGVSVRLLVPARNDSRLVQYASRWYFEPLLECGVEILLYRGGLLHTKSITIDGELALFGTVNLDTRSLHLNFELMLLLHDAAFSAALVALQQAYEAQADAVDARRWRARSLRERMKEGVANLVSPLL